jgi:hypothetical protein
MNVKLKHNCTFVLMYTNNLIKVFFKKNFKTSFDFCQMIKKTLTLSKY